MSYGIPDAVDSSLHMNQHELYCVGMLINRPELLINSLSNTYRCHQDKFLVEKTPNAGCIQIKKQNVLALPDCPDSTLAC